MYSEYSKIVDQVDFSDVTLVGEDGKEKSPPQLQILNWSEPYSIGLSVVQLLLPVREGTTNYSIQIVQYVPREFREIYLRKST